MTDQPAWGEGPSCEQAPVAPPRQRPRPGAGPLPAVAPGPSSPTDPVRAQDEHDGEPTDRLALVAVWCGVAGLALVGILAAIVTGVLAAEAGRRARERGTSARLAYYGVALAALDGVWFLVLHRVFDIPVWLG